MGIWKACTCKRVQLGVDPGVNYDLGWDVQLLFLWERFIKSDHEGCAYGIGWLCMVRDWYLCIPTLHSITHGLFGAEMQDAPKFARVKELLAMNEELKRARKAFELDEDKLATEFWLAEIYSCYCVYVSFDSRHQCTIIDLYQRISILSL